MIQIRIFSYSDSDFNSNSEMLTQILIIILTCISMILIPTLILIFRDSGSDAEGYPRQADSSANSLQHSSPQLC